MADTETKTSIKNWDGVDNKLKAIAENSAKRDEAEGLMNAKLLEVQNEYNDTLDALNKDITADTQDIIAYCKLNKEEFEANKTKQLNYGKIEIRNNPASIVERDKFTTEKVIAKIKAVYKKLAKTYIRTKEEIDKNALKSLNDKELKAIGLERKTSSKIVVTAFLKETAKKEAVKDNLKNPAQAV